MNWADEAPGEMRPFNQAASDMSTPYTGPSMIVMKFHVNPASKDYKRNWPRLVSYFESFFIHAKLFSNQSSSARSSFTTASKWTHPATAPTQNRCTRSRTAAGACSTARSTVSSTGRIWRGCRIFLIFTRRGSCLGTRLWMLRLFRIHSLSRAQCELSGETLSKKRTAPVTTAPTWWGSHRCAPARACVRSSRRRRRCGLCENY